MSDNITTKHPFKVVAKVDGGEIVVDAATDTVIITIYDIRYEAEIKMGHNTFKEFVGAIRELRI